MSLSTPFNTNPPPRARTVAANRVETPVPVSHPVFEPVTRSPTAREVEQVHKILQERLPAELASLCLDYACVSSILDRHFRVALDKSETELMDYNSVESRRYWYREQEKMNEKSISIDNGPYSDEKVSSDLQFPDLG